MGRLEWRRTKLAAKASNILFHAVINPRDVEAQLEILSNADTGTAKLANFGQAPCCKRTLVCELACEDSLYEPRAKGRDGAILGSRATLTFSDCNCREIAARM
jgi:hypothetical protein